MQVKQNRISKKSLNSPPSQSDGQADKTSERQLIVERLREHDGNVAKAARSLGITQTEINRLLRQYGLRDTL
jgi:transcriptional regulator with GAF, ATPase, and Fis domain